MSDHSGSRMLNNVLEILSREQVFSTLEKTTTQKLIREIVTMASRQYDCNPGEILEGQSQKFNLCYYCLTDADNLQNGLCEKCC